MQAKLTAATKSKEDLYNLNMQRRLAEEQAEAAALRLKQAEEEMDSLRGSLQGALAATKYMEQEKEEALMLLDSAHERTEKIEEDQQILLGYAESIATNLEPETSARRSRVFAVA